VIHRAVERLGVTIVLTIGMERAIPARRGSA
jgi:hypothetical protein